MRRIDLLLTLIAALVITTAVIINLPATTAQAQGVISLSPILIDTRNLKQVGDTFSINVTVANAQQLWGYQFAIHYNASIINITSVDQLDNRFVQDLGMDIGANYTSVQRAMNYGEPTGVTTTTAIPVDRLNFIVTGEGTTSLTFDPNYDQLANIRGEVIVSISVGGRFSNTEQLATHDVGITVATLNATSGKPGDVISITATIANLGDFTENITVTARFNRTLTTTAPIGTEQKITDLAQGGNSQITFTWDTAGVSDGKYQVTVEAAVAVDDNPADNTHTTIVTLSSGGGGGIPMQYIYVGVGVAVVVIAAIAVYALRARKP